jgi:thioredoxin 1
LKLFRKLVRLPAEKYIIGENMLNEPINVTDAAFDEAVLQSELPVVVDFWAPWCGPCKMVGPILEQIADDYSGKLIVAKVNTDENPEWAMKFGVQGIPTMLFVSEGNVLHQQVGAVPEPFLREIVDTFLETAQAEENAETAQTEETA